LESLHRGIVPIEQWLRDPFYNGPEARALAPFWYDVLVRYFRGDKHSILFSGSVRSGKSYCLLVVIKRYVYEISRWYDFPGLFGLSATTLPRIVFMSLSVDKAESTGLDRLIRMVDATPYFQLPRFKRRRINSELSFPWIKVVSGSDVNHLIGDDVFGAVLDEASLRGRTKSTAVQQIHEIFMEMRSRSETTFSVGGKWGGFSAIAATAGKATSFVDMQVQRAKRGDADFFLVEAAMYDVRPDSYSKERFKVYTGDGNVAPFICDAPGPEVLQVINGNGQSLEQFLNEREFLIVNPPVSLRHFYEEDIEFSLQNLSGVTRTGSSLFVSNTSLIKKMFDPSLKYPTRVVLPDGVPNFGIYDTLLPEELVDEDMLNSAYHGEPVYAHFDVSRVNDATGFSAIFLSEESGKIESVLVTPVYLDRSKPGNEIDQVKLVGLVVVLLKLGVNFRMVTGDGFGSEYLITRFKLLLGNDFAGRFSLDKTPAGYITMLNFMKLGMYRLYPVPRLQYELENLVYDKFLGKVDHPPNSDPVNPVYWKDVSDSLAGASFHLSVYEDLSYENMMVQSEIEKARHQGNPDAEEEDDFYSSLADGEDFYSGLADGVGEDDGGPEPADPLERMMREIMP
jgi:hypothetical protein